MFVYVGEGQHGLEERPHFTLQGTVGKTSALVLLNTVCGSNNEKDPCKAL